MIYQIKTATVNYSTKKLGWIITDKTYLLLTMQDTKNYSCVRGSNNPFLLFLALVGAAVFLVPKASDSINGQILYVDGGILTTIEKPANE